MVASSFILRKVDKVSGNHYRRQLPGLVAHYKKQVQFQWLSPMVTYNNIRSTTIANKNWLVIVDIIEMAIHLIRKIKALVAG